MDWPPLALPMIAPSAPTPAHASHIFRVPGFGTTLLFRTSRRAAAHACDLGDELHPWTISPTLPAARRYADVEQVVAAVRLKDLPVSDFKVGYAANAILVRFAIERRNQSAAQLQPIRVAAAVRRDHILARVGPGARQSPEFTGFRCRQASSLPQRTSSRW